MVIAYSAVIDASQVSLLHIHRNIIMNIDIKFSQLRAKEIGALTSTRALAICLRSPACSSGHCPCSTCLRRSHARCHTPCTTCIISLQHRICRLFSKNHMQLLQPDTCVPNETLTCTCGPCTSGSMRTDCPCSTRTCSSGHPCSTCRRRSHAPYHTPCTACIISSQHQVCRLFSKNHMQ